MPILSFNFDKISTERKAAKLPQKVDISHNLNIKDIKFDEIKFTDGSEKVLRFDFDFTIKYEPNIGETFIGGHLLFTDEKKKLDDIQKLWKKDKKLSSDVTMAVFNSILVKSNLKALQITQDVNLPPHVNLPMVRPINKEKSRKEDYIG